MDAALCVEQQCELRDLEVRSLQMALLEEPTAPSSIVPLFDALPQHPDWLQWQSHYLARPESYCASGECSRAKPKLEVATHPQPDSSAAIVLSGIFCRDRAQ